MAAERDRQRLRWFPRTVAVIGGLFFVGFGLWAMIDPESFFTAAAPFEPYNQHFLQDIGAFQLGLGAVLLLTAIPGGLDGLVSGLAGVGIGATAHAFSHIIGRDLGGTPATDIPLFAVVAILLLAAAVTRWRAIRP